MSAAPSVAHVREALRLAASVHSPTIRARMLAHARPLVERLRAEVGALEAELATIERQPELPGLTGEEGGRR